MKPELTHDRLGETFDAVMNPYDVQRRMEVLIDEFLADVDLNGRLVLDAGCGTGRGTAKLTAQGAYVICTDIGLRLLAYTRAHYPCAPAQADILAFPFAENTFDVVFSSEVIEHTPTPINAISEMVRVLKPGGALVLSTPNKLWQTPVRVASRIGLRPYDGLENFIRPRDLRWALEQQNGHIQQHRGLHLLPFQITPIWPLLRYMDRFGHVLLPLMINQAVLFIKADPILTSRK